MRAMVPHGDDHADEPTRFRRAAVWLRHHSTRIYIGLSAVILVLVLVGHLWTPDWWRVLVVSTMVLWLAADHQSATHALRWCEPCIQRRIIENGAAAAAAKHRQLRLFHLHRENTFVTLVPIAALMISADVHGFFNPVVLTVWLGWCVVTGLADATHSWHQLHCRWCHRGGGEHDRVDEPAPDPSDSAPVTPAEVRA